MQLLDLTLDDPALDLALDEALLDTAESSQDPHEVLRLWEPSSYFVVLGRSSPFDTEVNHDYCQRKGIPIYRRNSGGATVVCGPGCLMYCLLLSLQQRPALRMIDHAHQFVMESMQAALSKCGIQTEAKGICDLTIDQKKFSGNSLRCKRNHIIYHGTLLYDFDLELLAGCLGKPQRQPEYRADRTHGEFVTNLQHQSASSLRLALVTQWHAFEQLEAWPHELTAQLANERYKSRQWTTCR